MPVSTAIGTTARRARLRRNAPRATGMPTVDASFDFSRARRAYILGRVVRWLVPWRASHGRPPAVCGTPALARPGTRLRVVPLAAVVGTLEPTADFDARFRPATNRLRTRWERVALAHREDRPLPPITLLERADGYYVVDGRHRVSVARALALPDINAWVVPVMPSPLRCV